MATQSKKKNRKRSTEQKALNFLCIMMAAIIIFVAVVCVAVNKKNNALREKEKIASQSAENKPADGNGTTVASESDKDDSTDGTSAPDTTVAETVAVTDAVAKPGTIDNPTIITIDEEKWYLTLVNSSYRIPDTYEPDLVYVCGSGERLDRKVAEHYEEMYNAAKAEGINLTPCSGYRSYELQERNYNNKISFFESQGYSYEDAKVKAATIIMPPGSSEHNLGYAMDIVCVDEWFEDTAEFKWLTENAADYGFIMRYPKDKQDITKVIYEPWHWRYVGVELAKELKASGLVLEEYMGVA
ncbi:MAG: D-alanyl-D-alanine carboxypeptidase family protein [Acutalibacteraceae bacterium]